MTLTDALHLQAKSCAALGSPFMERLLLALAEEWPVGSLLDRDVQSYSGDIGPSGHSLPLRLASGLHALVLTEADAALAAVYPPNAVPDLAFRTEITRALAQHEAFLRDWITSPPQTNEVRRAAALVAGTQYLAAQTGVADLILTELGASAGLNLMFDHFALIAGAKRLGPEPAALTLKPDWTGDAPDAMPLTVLDRRGVDLNPLDPHNPDHALRLRAYLWPDQPHRLDLTNAAIASHDAQVDKADAVTWVSDRLATTPSGGLHVIFHTVAWQYFPKDAQDTGTALIEAHGAKATADAPLAWLSMEADGKGRGAALTARLWPGDIKISLGRCDFHGRWVDWTPIHH